MLADDQTMFREGLAELLNSRGDMNVVGQTNIGLVCAALAQKIKPDVVILQVESAIEKAKEILSELLRISPQPKVIIVTIFVALPRQALEWAEAGSGGVLSGRQLEVLVLAARGFSNRQIAVSLHLSVGTVKRHLVNIYAQMNVGSRGEAANKALSEGWITPRDIAWNEEKGVYQPALDIGHPSGNEI